MKYDLDTIEGQYAAGLFVAKNYWSKSQRTQSRCDRLHTSALISRLYLEDCKTSRNQQERDVLEIAWYAGINEGKRIRK